MNDPKPHLTLSPSFGDAESEISTVDSSHPETDGEFEFDVNAGALKYADEIFSNGWILPVYPVSGLKSDPDPDPDPTEFRSGSTSSTSSVDSIEIDSGSFCAWTPRSAPQSPDRTIKKGESGWKKWSVRDLIGRRRSHSYGEDRFDFLSKSGEGTKGKKDPKEMDMVAVHKLFYGNGKGEKKKDGKQRSFSPYRPELVGLFANNRTHHSRPFNL